MQRRRFAHLAASIPSLLLSDATAHAIVALDVGDQSGTSPAAHIFGQALARAAKAQEHHGGRERSGAAHFCKRLRVFLFSYVSFFFLPTTSAAAVELLRCLQLAMAIIVGDAMTLALESIVPSASAPEGAAVVGPQVRFSPFPALLAQMLSCPGWQAMGPPFVRSVNAGAARAQTSAGSLWRSCLAALKNHLPAAVVQQAMDAVR